MTDIKKFAKTDRFFAVIFGGVGCEREISCKTAGYIINTARECGESILPIGITEDGAFYAYFGKSDRILNLTWQNNKEALVPTFPVRLRGESGFLIDGRIFRPVSVLIALHGDHGEDGSVQGLLESAGIPYTGCRTVSGAISYDKAAAKAIAEHIGIPTVPWMLLTESDPEKAAELAEGRLEYPIFIKPSGQGSSFGAALVQNRSELCDAYAAAWTLGGGRVIAERGILGKRELECAYLDADGIRCIAPPGEIVTERGFYDYSAKYGDRTARLAVRAELSLSLAERVIEYTERLTRALSVRHIARVDYFLTDDGELFFNEINTFPGMTSASLYPSMLAGCGIDSATMIMALLTAPLSEVT